MHRYAIKEIYYTLQGEGAHTGRPAIFLRFAGCNLWSGREEDRHKAICKFCDTDFLGTDGVRGGKYEAHDITDQILDMWPHTSKTHPYVVCTGGEPLLQLDKDLINSLHDKRIEIAIETNGTLPVPEGVDWVCMSPKANTEIVVRVGDEIKFVFPQADIDPADFLDCDFQHYFIQPMDGRDLKPNTLSCIRYCSENPQWKLSVQTHKLLNIP
jgi:7-carboxy-7-deazaguanine synthase